MGVEFKDYYRTLGISADATEPEIKKAFRNLARKYHPDVAQDKKTAEEKFKELNEAHEVLSHRDSRRKYDELRGTWRSAAESGPAPGRPRGRTDPSTSAGSDGGFRFEGTGFSDFFEHFFGGRAARFGGPSPFESGGSPDDPDPSEADAPSGGAIRGPDIEGDILITLDEVLNGAMREISVRRFDTGADGERTETYPVRIPPGVQAGRILRIPGKGMAGKGGGGAGDIYLRVRYAHHPDWRPRGADLIGELELAPWEAVLGATIPVRTLESTVSVKVPAGTQAGHRLRVRGKGLPTGGSQRGDLYVAISIRVPTRVGPEEKRLWDLLAKESKFDARNDP